MGRPRLRHRSLRAAKLITAVNLKSRRDGLFIDKRPRDFFLFFSGAENTPRHVGSHRPTPLKNKKRTWVRWLAIYKQAIPTGFGRSPKSKAYAIREEMWVMIS